MPEQEAERRDPHRAMKRQRLVSGRLVQGVSRVAWRGVTSGLDSRPSAFVNTTAVESKVCSNSAPSTLTSAAVAERSLTAECVEGRSLWDFSGLGVEVHVTER